LSSVTNVKRTKNQPIPFCHISLSVHFQDYAFRLKDVPVGHSIQFRPFSLKLLENFYQGCGILCKKSIYIYIYIERERERESIWKNDVLVQRKWYTCLLYVLPQKGCRTKKKRKTLVEKSSQNNHLAATHQSSHSFLP